MELKLEDGLLTFDGQVVDYYNETGKSYRYHARYIQSIELENGWKDTKLMNLRYGVKGGSGFRGSIVPQDQLQQADTFINEVMAAASKIQA